MKESSQIIINYLNAPNEIRTHNLIKGTDFKSAA